MKRIHLPVKKPAEAYHPKSTVIGNERPTIVQLKQLKQQAPVQFQQSILALQSTLGNRAVVQLLSQLETSSSQEAVHHAATKGVQGSGGKLPHHDKIQRAFGGHDISQVQAYTSTQSAAANAAMGAKAYATGNKIAFAESNPDLHTAAHEAAHVIQQQAGVQLKGGVGKSGDKYERHADNVADLVVRGQSAQEALDTMAAKGSAAAGSQANVQAMKKIEVGMGMEGLDKEDKKETTTTSTVSKFDLLIAEMKNSLGSGPVFIGENHELSYGSDAVLALIKAGKVKKLFLELPPFYNASSSKDVDHITTEQQYDEVKSAYKYKGAFRGTVATRYSALTEYALKNNVEVYHADKESGERKLYKQIIDRNEYTSKLIQSRIDQTGAYTVVLGGADHYITEMVETDAMLKTSEIIKINPIHHQLGYGTTSTPIRRYFNLSKKELAE